MNYVRPVDSDKDIFERVPDLGRQPLLDLLHGWRGDPSDENLRKLIWRAYASGRRDQAYEVARHFLPRPMSQPEHYGFSFEVMVYCLVRSREPADVMAEVERIIEAEQRYNGESYWLHNIVACYLYNLDKRDPSAFLHFAYAAAQLKGFNDTYHISSGCETMRPVDYDLDDLAPQLSRESLTFHGDNQRADNRCVHLIGADSVYFCKYIDKLLETASPWRKDDDCFHAHVINADDEALKLIDALQEKYAWFQASSSRSPVSADANPRSCLAYFASARYIFAAEIMQRYRCSLVITDADFRVTQAYDEVVEQLRSVPAIFSTGISSQKSFYPWVRCAAGFSGFAFTDAGIDIARHVGDYICKTFRNDRSSRNWLIDQVALWHAYERYPGQIGRGRIAMLGVNEK